MSFFVARHMGRHESILKNAEEEEGLRRSREALFLKPLFLESFF